jgi:hypothetical protein
LIALEDFIGGFLSLAVEQVVDIYKERSRLSIGAITNGLMPSLVY